METLPAFGTAIPDIAQPTLKAYVPLLLANAAAIKSTPRETFSYGPHARQELDVYTPPSASRSSPILIFLYGGGLIRGGKTLTLPTGAAYADGLAHANVGHFFASKLGYTTVIPDYRLMMHGARLPSGGEDLGLVIKWVAEHLTSGDGEPRDLFLMGNSAGGVHLSTWLYAPEFVASRESVSGQAAKSGLRLKGAVMLSVPFHFRQALQDRKEVLSAYFGERVEEDSPLGLLKASKDLEDAEAVGSVAVLVLNGTLDPEDEILVPKRDFVEEWKMGRKTEGETLLSVEMMEGHNHLSPPLSLGTDKPEEEAWGFQVGKWIEANR